jgi:two-component system chemotaxis response regulator CheB
MSNRRIRVLIVDDSALVRKVLGESLAGDPEIEVVGTAMDPYVARDKILQLNPDVLTLDLEMPRMDGLSFLKLVMKHRPMPVIIISSLTTAGSSRALEALQAGAVDVMSKPGGSSSAAAHGAELAAKIKAAFNAKVRSRSGDTHFITRPATAAAPGPSASLVHRLPGIAAPEALRPAVGPARHYSNKQIILMGASTGGTEALKAVLTNLSGTLPGICIVQHIPAHFSRAFAERLNQLCAFEVREARPGDRVQPGLALVAPGGHHLVLRRVGASYSLDLSEAPPVHHQRPAVDVLFDSAVRAGAGPHALALLLTGMGADGAAGLLKLKEAGATTVVQNEESCVVFGMPREAIRLGAAQKVLPLDQMAAFIERHSTDAAIAPVGP